jgi:hypothetical protein
MTSTPDAQPNYFIQIIFPFITLLLGYFGSLFTEWRRDKRLEEREKKTREALREQVIEDRRSSFQRETLLELSDILYDLGSKVSEINDYYKKNGAGKLSIESFISEEFSRIQIKISRLRVRILDENLRKLVHDTQGNSFKVIFAKNEVELKKEYNNCMDNRNNANELLGKLLRELY